MDIHFNSYKARYDMLDQSFALVKNSRIIRNVNIYINLDDLIHTLHKPTTNNEFQLAGKDAVKMYISNVLNLIGHYRYWVIKRCKLPCKVFAIYTTTDHNFKNNLYIGKYRNRFRDIMDESNGSFYFINQVIKKAEPVLRIMSKYIPDVYLIDSRYIEPSVVPAYIQTIENADWNYYITRDPYDLQYTFRDKWTMISPKGDNTRVLSTDSIWNYINEKEHVYRDMVDLKYPFSLYNYAKSVVGDRYRSIPRLHKIGWKTLFKYLDKVVEGTDSKTPEAILKQRFADIMTSKKVEPNEFNDNLLSIDLDYQLNSFLVIDHELIRNQIIDIPDYENLKMLNKEQFYLYPINLEFLTYRVNDARMQNTSRYKSPFDK